MFDDIVLCGQSFNATTGYVGPGTVSYLGGATDYSIGGTACDALDSTTEATADAPIATNFPAFRVHGLYCRISSDPTSDVVVTARSAAADLSGSFTCTIAGSGAVGGNTATSCRTTNTSTSEVASGATIAVKVVTLEDLSLQDVWCKLFFSVK